MWGIFGFALLVYVVIGALTLNVLVKGQLISVIPQGIEAHFHLMEKWPLTYIVKSGNTSVT